MTHSSATKIMKKRFNTDVATAHHNLVTADTLIIGTRAVVDTFHEYLYHYYKLYFCALVSVSEKWTLRKCFNAVDVINFVLGEKRSNLLI